MRHEQRGHHETAVAITTMQVLGYLSPLIGATAARVTQAIVKVIQRREGTHG